MRRLACITLSMLLAALPVAAQEEQSGVTYSWMILMGLLVSIVLLGVILQLRKTKPKENPSESGE